MTKYQRKFCCHSCSASITNIVFKKEKLIGKSRKLPRNNCLYCGAECNKPRQKYCNLGCQADFKNIQYINDWKSGIINGCLEKSGKASGTIHRYIWEKYDHKCARCGWCEKHPILGYPPLEIEHIDGDWRNCTERQFNSVMS